MKIKAIVNPRAANNKTKKQWAAIKNIIQKAVGEIHDVFTAGPNDAANITRQAIQDGYDWIIAVGGDGTINEAVNGFIRDDSPINPSTCLSFIMSATGGDFRKSFGIPASIDRQVHALAHGKERWIDIGKVSFHAHDGAAQTRYFNNIASFGMSGEVDRVVNSFKAAKLLGGRAAFLLASLKIMLTYRNKEVRIIVDDRFDQTVKVRVVIVANGRYAGGGMCFAPQASLDDGLFDVVVIGETGLIRSAINMPRIYSGTYLSDPDIISLRGKKVIAQSDQAVLLDVDGEAPGRLPATFEVIPRAIRIKC